MSLYTIIKEIAELDWYDEETGEIDLEKKKQLDELKFSFDDKAENIIRFIKNLNADAKVLKEEETKIKDRREKKEKKAEALTKYLENMMLLSEREKLEYVSGEAKFRKISSVEVQDDFVKWAEINAKHLLSFKEPTANKIAIKEAIKNGEEINFAQIIENRKISIS